jgi:amino acid transporter
MKPYEPQAGPLDASGIQGTLQRLPPGPHRFISDYDHVDHILESPTAPDSKSAFYNTQESISRVPVDYVRVSPRVLGTSGVAAVTFFYGCGGPLGSESIVAMGGPLLAMLALTVYPLLFTIPYGVVVTELCSAFPEDGGFTIWATNAFGAFWGLQIGYWSWVAGILGAAIYPTYLLDFICQYGHLETPGPTLGYVSKAGISLVLSLPTFLSTRIIGRGAVALLCCVLMPLVLYVIWCLVKFKDGHQLSIVREDNMAELGPQGSSELDTSTESSYYDILNAVFWNYDGIQMASVFGGQVLNPARVYSRAIAFTLTLTMCAYILPIPATLVTQTVAWNEFTRGVYVDGAVAVGGQFLRVLLVVSTLSSNIGLFMSSLFCKAFEMAGMADSQLLPRVFGIRNETFGSPQHSILLTMTLTAVLAGVDTATLVPVANVFAALVTFTIFAAAIQLRITLPYMPRPSLVPGGMRVLMSIAVIPTVVCGYLIVKNLIAGVCDALLIVGFLVPGLAYGLYQSRYR